MLYRWRMRIMCVDSDGRAVFRWLHEFGDRILRHPADLHGPHMRMDASKTRSSSSMRMVSMMEARDAVNVRSIDSHAHLPTTRTRCTFCLVSIPAQAACFLSAKFGKPGRYVSMQIPSHLAGYDPAIAFIINGQEFPPGNRLLVGARTPPRPPRPPPSPSPSRQSLVPPHRTTCDGIRHLQPSGGTLTARNVTLSYAMVRESLTAAAGRVALLLLVAGGKVVSAHDHDGSDVPEGEVVSPEPLDSILWWHICTMIVAFGILFPIGMVLGIVRSRWHVPVQVLYPSYTARVSDDG